MDHFEFDDVEQVFMIYPPTFVLAYESILLRKLAVAQPQRFSKLNDH
jgi:hypothetical protein